MSGKGGKGGKGNNDEKQGGLTKEQTATLMPLLQKQLESSIIGKSSGYLESLPVQVQNRVRALKHLQSETDKLEDEFEKEEAALLKKYAELKAPFFARRSEIVTGTSEPKPEELVKKEGEEELKSTSTETADVKGIPEFWLTTLQHTDEFGELITEDDEPALKHLIDVTSTPLPDEEKATPSFVLNFHFSPNDYFDNTIISKKYILSSEGGDMIFDHTESTEIKWKAGKNLTKKMVTQQQKIKGGKGGRGGRGGKGASAPTKTVTVEKDVPSFFRYFAADPTDDEVEDEQELQDIMESDYEMGLTVRDQIIPDAVKYFTGDIEPSMYGDYEDDEEEDDDDEEGGAPRGGEDDEYNSEEDEDFDPSKQAPEGKQPECKQQ